MKSLAMDLLNLIALGEGFSLHENQREAFHWLLENGFIKRAAPAKNNVLNETFEALQDQHALFVQAKSVLERLVQKVGEGKGLLGFLSEQGLKENDPDALELFRILERLEFKFRNVNGPSDLPRHLDHIRDRLNLDDRDCLDRMTRIDRELNAVQPIPIEGVHLEGEGHIVLSQQGRMQFPEYQSLELCEAVFAALNGPRKHKISDFKHFKDDPSTMIQFMMENPHQIESLTERMAAFESMASSFMHQMPFLELSSFRLKNAFLMRLCLDRRKDPKLVFQLCRRDRLMELQHRAQPLLGRHLSNQDSLLIAGYDLLTRPSHLPTPPKLDPELHFPLILEGFQQATQERALEDRLLIALSIALFNQLDQTDLQGDLKDPIHHHIDVIKQARLQAPVELGRDGDRWVFGYYIAHLSGFDRQRIQGIQLRHKAVAEAFKHPNDAVPLAVKLHATFSLQRLELGGLFINPTRYAATYRRIHRALLQHPDLGRSLQAPSVSEQDAWFLAAYLCARTYFQDPDANTSQQRIGDIGLAGRFEAPTQDHPPLLGKAFGSLMA